MKNASGIIYSYKLLITEETVQGFFELRAPYQSSRYFLHTSKYSDRLLNNITPFELLRKEVNKGLYFFMKIEKEFYCERKQKLCAQIKVNRKISCKKQCPSDIFKEHSLPIYKWAQFEIIPNDIVAVGKFWDLDSFVTHKAKLVKVLKDE